MPERKEYKNRTISTKMSGRDRILLNEIAAKSNLTVSELIHNVLIDVIDKNQMKEKDTFPSNYKPKPIDELPSFLELNNKTERKSKIKDLFWKTLTVLGIVYASIVLAFGIAAFIYNHYN